MGKKKSTRAETEAKQSFKRKVRRSTNWAELRTQIRSEQKVDPISMRPLSRSFAVHHLSQDERYYDDLSRDRFVGVNDYSHRICHYLYDIVMREGDYEVLNRIKLIIEQMINLTESDKLRADGDNK